MMLLLTEVSYGVKLTLIVQKFKITLQIKVLTRKDNIIKKHFTCLKKEIRRNAKYLETISILKVRKLI